MRMKVRSLVGLLPFCATTVIYPDILEKFPEFTNRVRRFLERNPRLVANISPPKPGYKGRAIMSGLNENKLRRILRYMLDEKEFSALMAFDPFPNFTRNILTFFKQTVVNFASAINPRSQRQHSSAEIPTGGACLVSYEFPDPSGLPALLSLLRG
jgi:hypothetical protein